MIVPNLGLSLKIRVFEVNPDEDADDRELLVDSVEIDDGTIWVYVKEVR